MTMHLSDTIFILKFSFRLITFYFYDDEKVKDVL